MKRKIVQFCILSAFAVGNLCYAAESDTRLEARVDSVLRLMTLTEKIGQMNQLSNKEELTGQQLEDFDTEALVRAGKVGSLLNVAGAEETRRYQEIAVKDTRLHIPLVFGLDVIHGFRTISPVPLAESCSWNMELIELSARIAAIEASAAGLQWTFAPMVDIAHDPRWGRVMEGAGEDPYLGAAVAVARVKGFQGDDLSAENTIAACAKHFAGYGAVEGGREYNTVDLSAQRLRELYLPPFAAAAEAGVATFMNAFNELMGVPATGSYKVYAFFPQLKESTTHTPVTVYTGVDTVQVQVHKDDVKVVGQTGGEWVSVGEYTLPRGREAYVEISNLGTDNTVAADAVLFLPQEK